MVTKVKQPTVRKTTKSQQKTAKNDDIRPTKVVPHLASQRLGGRQFDRSTWRTTRGETMQVNVGGQGLTVFAPVDPYQQKQRKEFRSAMSNPYVYRASRIQATMTVGQGYTTEIVPRDEEEIPDDQLDDWQKNRKIRVPGFGDKEFTPEQIKDRIDKMAIDMDLSTNIFNAYMTAIEQGRCVLALTPLETDEAGHFFLPEQIKLIRPEFTERPVLDDSTGELKGVRIIGVNSPTKDNILPQGRMIYIMHGFNNELFSDFYGDSKVSRVADEANTLNIILNQDFERAAENTWYKPPIYSVPIPPQEFGNEDGVLNEFLAKANDSKGQSVAVTGPSAPDEKGVEVLNSPPTADIGGLDLIRTGLIKAIITAYGLPGFMLSEGDIGKLGGNANIEEVDAYLNQEIRPERIILENMVEKQYFDSILAILFGINNADDLPVKIKIQFNKPRLVTLLTPDMFEVLMGLVSAGLIDESGMRDILGIEELDKETVSKGAQGGARPGASRWNRGIRPIQTEIHPHRSRWRFEDTWSKLKSLVNQLPEQPSRSLWSEEDTWEVDPARREWMNARGKRLLNGDRGKQSI